MYQSRVAGRLLLGFRCVTSGNAGEFAAAGLRRAKIVKPTERTIMLLKNAIEEINGLRFVMERLELQSGLAKRVLYTLPYLHLPEEIARELDEVETMQEILRDEERQGCLAKINVKLMQVKDIRGTVQRVREAQGLEDVELFELKVFALLVQELRDLLQQARVSLFPLPDLEPVVDLLDPDRVRVPHFYVYDAYSPELARLRQEMKRLKQAGQDADSEQVYFRSLVVEDEIRDRLSRKLVAYGDRLSTALQHVAKLDILLAKAKQARDMQFCKPEISKETTSYKAIFNPQVKTVLEQAGKCFQAIDIELRPGACLITGANMAGKSVLLKTVALAQTLFQFGFYVPAQRAEVALVDEVLLCIGDEQCELQGLSSFASEMLRVNRIMQEVKSGKKVLVLIDELARTTNPEEGKAIVHALLDFLSRHQVRSLITSHYSGIRANCRRLRVRGFVKERLPEAWTIQRLPEYMDYALCEDDQEQVPREAIRIARLLGVDEELLHDAEVFLRQE